MGKAHQPNYHVWGPHEVDDGDDQKELAKGVEDSNLGTDNTGGARRSGSGSNSGIEMGMELQLRIHIDSPEVQAGAPEDVGSGDSLVFSGRLNYFPRYPYTFFKISNLEFSAPKL